MITNERQYRIIKSQAERFRDSLRHFDEIRMIQEGVDPVIVAAHRDSISEQLRQLDRRAADYEELRSGTIRTLTALGVILIGEKLIQARIARGLSQRDLAERLGMKEQQIQRYEQDRYRTASLIRLAEITTALDLDAEIDLKLRGGDQSKNKTQSTSSIDLGRLPAREMAKRGWIEDAKNLDALQRLATCYVTTMLRGVEGPGLHRLNVRVNGKVESSALLAWKARVVEKSRNVIAPGYDPRALDARQIQSLVKLSAHPQGPLRAIETLRHCGLRVVFERHLPSTHLDGAAMLDENGNPVIGMTVRYDRLDNFWFVLMHEIGHVVCHRERGLQDGFFDDEQADAIRAVELEADEFALSALIAKEAWDQSFVRYTTNRHQVLQFAEQQGIDPAIVCGRIRKERGDYTVFGDLLGRGRLGQMLSSAGLMEP